MPPDFVLFDPGEGSPGGLKRLIISVWLIGVSIENLLLLMVKIKMALPIKGKPIIDSDVVFYRPMPAGMMPWKLWSLAQQSVVPQMKQRPVLASNCSDDSRWL